MTNEHISKLKDMMQELTGLPRGIFPCSKCGKKEQITDRFAQQMFITDGTTVFYCVDCWAKTIAKQELATGKIITQTYGVQFSNEQRALIDEAKKTLSK